MLKKKLTVVLAAGAAGAAVVATGMATAYSTTEPQTPAGQPSAGEVWVAGASTLTSYPEGTTLEWADGRGAVLTPVESSAYPADPASLAFPAESGATSYISFISAPGDEFDQTEWLGWSDLAPISDGEAALLPNVTLNFLYQGEAKDTVKTAGGTYSLGFAYLKDSGRTQLATYFTTVEVAAGTGQWTLSGEGSTPTPTTTPTTTPTPTVSPSLPVSGGVSSLVVRRGNEYHVKYSISSGQADQVVYYGKATDTILVGDWDGDGVDTLAVRRGNAYHIKNSITGGAADQVVYYGGVNDTVVVGDWDGDGKDTLAVRRGNVYHIKNSISSGAADKVVAYGGANDTIVIGDWDGDGVDTLAVRRGNVYHIKNSISSGKADKVVAYGGANDVILVGDWDGDGVDTLAVRRGNVYHIKNSISSGKADKVVAYGGANDTILVGTWK